jgi:tetratricopeptide (TPR) repeat protein
MNDQLDEAHYNLAVCLFGQLNYNNALLSIKKAIDLYPTNMQYHELHKNIVTRINNY